MILQQKRGRKQIWGNTISITLIPIIGLSIFLLYFRILKEGEERRKKERKGRKNKKKRICSTSYPFIPQNSFRKKISSLSTSYYGWTEHHGISRRFRFILVQIISSMPPQKFLPALVIHDTNINIHNRHIVVVLQNLSTLFITTYPYYTS